MKIEDFKRKEKTENKQLMYVYFLILILGIILYVGYLFLNRTQDEIGFECIDINHENEYAQLNVNDIILLSKIINAEVHGESYKDKLLVGSVILNRVNNKEFPNTLYDVIYQKNQFHGVTGKYFRYSNKRIQDKESKSAALEILKNGPINKDILYFHNPKTAKNSEWINKIVEKGVKFRMENHIYI